MMEGMSVQYWLNAARFEWMTGKVTIFDLTREQNEEGYSAIFKPPYGEKIQLLGIVKIPEQLPDAKTIPRFRFIAEDRHYRYIMNTQRNTTGQGQVYIQRVPK